MPLHIASFSGQLEVIKYLIGKKKVMYAVVGQEAAHHSITLVLKVTWTLSSILPQR